MSDDLIFYTNPMSRGRTARWMLEEVGHPYRTEILDYDTTMKEEAYLSINPMGKVPAIVHKGRVVTETAAICAYLADAFPGVGLAPPPADRADYYRWLFFTSGPMEQAWVDKTMGVEPTQEQQRMTGYGTFDRVLAVLEMAVVGRKYIAGDQFSAADLYVSAQLGFGLYFGMIPKRPAFTEYVERHANRPAAIRAREIDDASSTLPEPA